MCARVLFVLVYGVKQINALIIQYHKNKIKCKQRSKLSMKDNFLDNAS